MKIKPGVDLRGVRPEIVVAMLLLEPVLLEHDSDFVVTSCTDGKHMAGSKHYEGLAIDVRSRNLPKERHTACLIAMRETLGPQFDVILEGDHFHVEFDPK